MEDYLSFGNIDEISVVDALAEVQRGMFTDATDLYAYFGFEDSTFHGIRL